MAAAPLAVQASVAAVATTATKQPLTLLKRSDTGHSSASM
jgi:hypothetical protein